MNFPLKGLELQHLGKGLQETNVKLGWKMEMSCHLRSIACVWLRPRDTGECWSHQQGKRKKLARVDGPSRIPSINICSPSLLLKDCLLSRLLIGSILLRHVFRSEKITFSVYKTVVGMRAGW